MIVIVQSGLQHCGARVDWDDDGDFVWLDVNLMGSHLPQRYRRSELISFDFPSELMAHGLCVACLAFGVVDNGIRGPSACSLCRGTGRFGWSVDVHRSTDVIEARFTVEPGTQDAITCELCRAAVNPGIA